MTDLLSQLQSATEGSWRLNLEIAETLGWRIDQYDVHGRAVFLAPGSSHTQYLPNWTGDLQDAVSPAEQVDLHPVEVLERAMLWMRNDRPSGPLTIDLLCRYCCMVIIKAHEAKAAAA